MVCWHNGKRNSIGSAISSWPLQTPRRSSPALSIHTHFFPFPLLYPRVTKKRWPKSVYFSCLFDYNYCYLRGCLITALLFWYALLLLYYFDRVKDDNHILPEWIAYHYTQLPLRHLVVGVDPLSNSPPTEILRRWNRTSSKHVESDEYPNMDMEIQMWGDEQIYRGMDPEEAFKNAYHIAHMRKNMEGEEVIRLNNRLMFFFSRCMEYHKLQGRTWVLLIDSDEFLTFNYMHSNDVTDPPRPAIQELAPKLSNESLGQLRWWRRRTNYQMDVQKRLPPAETTTIAEFILAEADQHPWKFEDIACYSFPRLMYGAQESEESQVRAGVPDGVDPYKLQTLRFIRHSPKIKNNKNRSGKNMIDVSRLSLKDLWKTSGSPHHTLENECWQEFRFNTILRANHYLGSWEVSHTCIFVWSKSSLLLLLIFWMKWENCCVI